MVGKRMYDDVCAVAHALDLVGERWALLIVRELLLGPKRFTDLRHGLAGVGPNVLAQRLRDLQAVGILMQRTLPPPAASTVYELTEWGLELEPVVLALGRWGSRSPGMQHDAPLSIDALMLAMRTLFAPDRADGLHVTFSLRLGKDSFNATIANREFTIGRSVTPGDVTVTTQTDVLNDLIWGDGDLNRALADEVVLIDGDVSRVARLLELFPLPFPAAGRSE